MRMVSFWFTCCGGVRVDACTGVLGSPTDRQSLPDASTPALCSHCMESLVPLPASDGGAPKDGAKEKGKRTAKGRAKGKGKDEAKGKDKGAGKNKSRKR